MVYSTDYPQLPLATDSCFFPDRKLALLFHMSIPYGNSMETFWEFNSTSHAACINAQFPVKSIKKSKTLLICYECVNRIEQRISVSLALKCTEEFSVGLSEDNRRGLLHPEMPEVVRML